VLPATAFFGTLFVPAPRGLATSDGPISDAPGYSYHFDQEAGHLTITHKFDDGTSDTVFDGRYDKDGVFRDKDGNAVGRFLGDSVALDADAVRGYEARRRSDAQAPPGAIVQSVSTTRDDPKLCPDTTEEETKGRKDRGTDYQAQISGLPPGFDFKLKDPLSGKLVSFDACWEEKDGTMGEAKGPGYEKQMVGPDDWQDWYTGDDQIRKQMASQSRAAAAAGKRVEWHFAEPGPARYVNDNRDTLPNIDVFYTPPVMKHE
jgi:restriction endonuclease fold toxin 5 of polymorphic toxin system